MTKDYRNLGDDPAGAGSGADGSGECAIIPWIVELCVLVVVAT